ncbi:hypothetical protein [Methylobacterium aquaticum]|nr:hypothetical protein [Methylobacterium aquaticum]
MAGANGEAGGSASVPWDLIRQVLERGRADGLNDVQLASGIHTVLMSHGLLADPEAIPATVGELYDWARRELGEGGERIEFKACRYQETGDIDLSAVESGGEGVYVSVGAAPTLRAFISRIREEQPIPEGLEQLVRLAVEKIRRQQVAA